MSIRGITVGIGELLEFKKTGRTLPETYNNKKLNGFEKREKLGKDYWNDPRWAKVKALRKAGQNSKANGLVCAIRADWGL